MKLIKGWCVMNRNPNELIDKLTSRILAWRYSNTDGLARDAREEALDYVEFVEAHMQLEIETRLKETVGLAESMAQQIMWLEQESLLPGAEKLMGLMWWNTMKNRVENFRRYVRLCRGE